MLTVSLSLLQRIGEFRGCEGLLSLVGYEQQRLDQTGT